MTGKTRMEYVTFKVSQGVLFMGAITSLLSYVHAYIQAMIIDKAIHFLIVNWCMSLFYKDTINQVYIHKKTGALSFYGDYGIWF